MSLSLNALWEKKNLLTACPSGDGIQFWTHEWEKHGTCSESSPKQHDYFETTLNLKQNANLLDALTSACKYMT